MKYVATVVITIVVIGLLEAGYGASDSTAISACGSACAKWSQPMASYSKQNGCVCVQADGGAR